MLGPDIVSGPSIRAVSLHSSSLRFAIEEQYPPGVDWSDDDRVPVSWTWASEARLPQPDGSEPWVTLSKGQVASADYETLLQITGGWADALGELIARRSSPLTPSPTKVCGLRGRVAPFWHDPSTSSPAPHPAAPWNLEIGVAVPAVLPQILLEAVSADALVVTVNGDRLAAIPVRRDEITATVTELVASLGSPTRVEVREMDGSVHADILTRLRRSRGHRSLRRKTTHPHQWRYRACWNSPRTGSCPVKTSPSP